MTTDLQDFHRIGVPLLSFVYFLVVLIGAAVCMAKHPPLIELVGGTRMSRLFMMALLCFQVFAGIFLVLTTLAPTMIFFWVLPLIGLYAFRTLDGVFLSWFAALQTLAVFLIVGLSGSGLFEALMSSTCAYRYGPDHDDLCKDHWKTFVSFMLLLYYFFTLVLLPAALYFYSLVSNGQTAHLSAATATGEAAPLMK
eukprot:m.67718 g.67718  ORF g.67718 m.67718 type:complete len:196 (+) comp14133_c0_seq1:43-630(+)